MTSYLTGLLLPRNWSLDVNFHFHPIDNYPRGKFLISCQLQLCYFSWTWLVITQIETRCKRSQNKCNRKSKCQVSMSRNSHSMCCVSDLFIVVVWFFFLVWGEKRELWWKRLIVSYLSMTMTEKYDEAGISMFKNELEIPA